MAKASHDLPEVTVKATKLKMVMQGDTIVYNADALNLADGSMLEALISKLPGAKLNKNGQIFVNGKYIQSLLVNGKDFFKGNPKLALENLPAYTVNKIKVYNKAGAASRIMDRDMGDKSYVMDVRLKKEYSTGYMGNVEAGIGTKDRYEGKYFGMKFTDMERVMLFGNSNNLNDNQRARFNGEWSPQDVPDGLSATQSIGFSYLKYLGDEDSWVSTDNTYSHTNVNNQSRTSSQTFLTGGDSYKRIESLQLSRNTVWKSYNEFSIQKFRSGYYLLNALNLSYASNKGKSNSILETSDSISALNQLLTMNSDESNLFSFAFLHEGGHKITPDYLRWKISANYDHTNTMDFSLNDVQYMNGLTPRDYRNNYRHNSNQHWDLNGNLSYSIDWLEKSINPEYDYRYIYNKTSNLLYRLDKLNGIDSTRFDLLSSTREALLGVMDLNNSYNYHEY
ncbi:MAG: hypothetical protein WAR39_09400 [Prevotella sp.]